MFVAAIGAAGYYFFQENVRSRLCQEVKTRIDAVLVNSDIRADLSAAKFIEGSGLLLHDLEVEMPQLRMSAYETFVQMPVTTTDLVMGSVKPEAVEMRRVKFEFTRMAGRELDFLSLFQSIHLPSGQQTVGMIPVRIRDSQFTLVDQASGFEKVFTDIDLDLTPITFDGRELLEVRLKGMSNDVDQLTLNAFIDPQAGNYKTQVALAQAKLNLNWLSLVPQSLQQHLQYVRSLNGRVSVSGSVSGSYRSKLLPQFSLTGRIDDVNFDDSRMPFPMLDGKAGFTVSNSGIQIEKASGRVGEGNFGLDYWQAGIGKPRVWQVSGFVNRFNFNHTKRFEAWLPDHCGNFCDAFSPTGLCDVSGKVVCDGQQIKKQIDGRIVDMGFKYERFPYQLDHCVGSVHWVDDLLTYQMQSRQTGRTLKVHGSINRPGPDATYETHLSADGSAPIDEKLLTAVDAVPKLAKIVRDFNPNGRVSGTGLIRKLQPGGLVSKTFDVEFVDASIRHNHFAYPIESVRGVVHYENDGFSFENLTGSNGVSKISCNGQWNPESGLSSRFICNQVQLDERLRMAIRPELREIWDGFRPRGTAELIKVDLTLPIGSSSCNVIVDADLAPPENGVSASNVSVYPTWFPYEINEVGGRIKVGNGKVDVKDFKGKHGRSFITCQGTGEYNEASWTVTLKKMLVLALKVDENLFAALPSTLVPQLRALQFEGLLNVNGEITLAGLLVDESKQEPIPRAELAHWNNQDVFPGQAVADANGQIRQTGYTSVTRTADRRGKFQPRSSVNRAVYSGSESEFQANTTMAWNVGFNMNQAKMLVGLPIKNVFGRVDLAGIYDGENAKCEGALQIDSMTIYDAQITNVKGPLWLDNDKAAGGVLAVQEINRNNAATVSPVTQQLLAPRSITGEMYGGVVRFDAIMNADEKAEFYLQTTLADGNLKQACQELAPSLDHVAGHAFAALRMSGSAPNVHSYRGQGTMQLRDAKIYELPAVLSMLKLFKVKQIDRTAFDTGNIDFTVNGENIDLNRMEFNGDAISLIGNGAINMNQDLDLNFYSVMGRNRFEIPLISELYRASSQKIMWINIGGTCGNPKMSREILPQLNDSLRQLFQQPRNEKQW